MPLIQVQDATRTFPLLADPGVYRACLWDLRRETAKRSYWLGLFRRHFGSLLEEALRDADDAGEDLDAVAQRSEAARAEFEAFLDRARDDPEGFEKLDILEVCWARERVLRTHGFDDAYRLAKRTENDKAMRLLPALLRELDAMGEADRRVAAIKGVFAGNIFDLGATETLALYEGGKSLDFDEVRSRLKDRPWHTDDLDAWLGRLDGPPHTAACLFVDNAGPDICLGMIPFARELLKRGTRVVLTANTLASLNDVTHDELVALIDQAAGFDPVLADALTGDRLRLVPSGNWAPLIDLSRVSPELVEAVTDSGFGPIELVVLEGMGRAIESNFNAELTCETLKLAMIKDQGVSDSIGASLYDLVCRYEPGGPR